MVSASRIKPEVVSCSRKCYIVFTQTICTHPKIHDVANGAGEMVSFSDVLNLNSNYCTSKRHPASRKLNCCKVDISEQLERYLRITE